jgi:antitoxin (DNA-binding transcriptional repressor) of toxin-antitoxin stability system
MKKANISYTRNHLSEMISQVREGETILIVDRQRPVARLEPVGGAASRDVPWQADLVRRGLVRLARARLDVKALGALRMAVPNEDADILAALLDEREGGR